eukprot:4849681-Alexandrium_andersonii.AAC.1
MSGGCHCAARLPGSCSGPECRVERRPRDNRSNGTRTAPAGLCSVPTRRRAGSRGRRRGRSRGRPAHRCRPPPRNPLAAS